MEKEHKIAVIKIINELAEEHVGESLYDDDYNAYYTPSWTECIDMAVDDFLRDVRGWMACRDIYDLTPKQIDEIEQYAFKEVNWTTIRDVLFDEEAA